MKVCKEREQQCKGSTVGLGSAVHLMDGKAGHEGAWGRNGSEVGKAQTLLGLQNCGEMFGFYSKCDGKLPECFKWGQTGSNEGFENLGLCEDLATRRTTLKLSQSSGDRWYKMGRSRRQFRCQKSAQTCLTFFFRLNSSRRHSQ